MMKEKLFMKRSVLLDIIRAISVIIIILVHILQEIEHPLGGFFGIKRIYYVSGGGIAVSILLIISGIVLQLRYGSGDIKYWSFLKKRVLRIYPTYFLVLGLGSALYLVRKYFGWSPLSDLKIIDIPLSLTGMYAIFGRWGGPIIGTSWFLAIIMSLYLVFPILSVWIRKKPHLVIFLLFIISLLSRLLLGRYPILPSRSLDWFLLCRVFEFGLGIYLAQMLPVGIWYVLNRSADSDRFINYLGELSFPIFLVHWPIFHTFKNLYTYGVPFELWVILFVAASLVVSLVLLEIDKKYLSPMIMSKLCS